MKHVYMNVSSKPDIKNNTINRSKNTRQEIHKNIHIYIYRYIYCIYVYTQKQTWNFPNDGLEKVYLPLNNGNILVSLKLPGCTGQHHRGLHLRSASAKSPLQRDTQGEKKPLAQKRSPMGLCQCLVFERERLRIIQILEVSIGCNTV